MGFQQKYPNSLRPCKRKFYHRTKISSIIYHWSRTSIEIAFESPFLKFIYDKFIVFCIMSWDES